MMSLGGFLPPVAMCLAVHWRRLPLKDTGSKL